VTVATAVALLIAAPLALAAPVSLLLPQGTGFSILGHSCGGIQEKSYATGFDPSSGYPTGDVYISTSCGGSGRDGGGHSTLYSAWVGVTWDFTGVMVSDAKLSAAPTVDPTLSAFDSSGNQVYNDGYSHAYLVLAAGFVPVPRLLGISVSAGPATGGTSVTIGGTGFTGATGVSFGATPAASFTINNDNSITATSPTASPGTVDVTVTSAGGTSATSAGDQFTFVGRPVVTGVNPSSGPVVGGGWLTITGQSLAAATSVSFGDQPTGFSANPDGSLTAYIPPGEGPDSVDITVTSLGGTSAVTRAAQYTYVTGPVPTVSGVSPRFGGPGGGTTVTITGTHFTPDATVQFGSVAADSTYVSAGELSATAPPGSAGAADVTVTTSGGPSATGVGDLFAYGAPTVSSFTPASGITGSRVTITGSGFAPGLSASFGALRSPPVQVLSGTVAVATVPNGATSGAIAVADPQGSRMSARAFTPTLSITGFSPGSGPIGTAVVIRGVGFRPGSVVRFGSGPAAKVTYLSANRLRATVPSGALGGRITVTNAGAPKGTVRSQARFNVG
jgi:hypothetical protein